MAMTFWINGLVEAHDLWLHLALRVAVTIGIILLCYKNRRRRSKMQMVPCINSYLVQVFCGFVCKSSSYNKPLGSLAVSTNSY